MKIRSLSAEVFEGKFNEELYREYSHWLPWIVDVFLPIVESEHGDFRSLPFPGSIMDQPYMTMSVLKVIQASYRKHLTDQMKKIKMKRG